ncbi:MAG: DJ-1/PfpI family protein [Candidatus Symbiothrix sp.]|nr:DJ-1/PfpI family protein [Candidatus Symbiothrix sp.]
MMQTFVFLADGFEEIEAVGIIDVLRRSGMEVTVVSISKYSKVVGAHGITVMADIIFEMADFSQGQMLVLPGGNPGTQNLDAHKGLKMLIQQYANQGKYIAAICAAPMVLGSMNLLRGKRATVYPGCEEYLKGATIVPDPVVVDGNIITGRGPGSVFEFATTLVTEMWGEYRTKELAEGMLLQL